MHTVTRAYSRVMPEAILPHGSRLFYLLSEFGLHCHRCQWTNVGRNQFKRARPSMKWRHVIHKRHQGSSLRHGTAAVRHQCMKSQNISQCQLLQQKEGGSWIALGRNNDCNNVVSSLLMTHIDSVWYETCKLHCALSARVCSLWQQQLLTGVDR